MNGLTVPDVSAGDMMRRASTSASGGMRCGARDQGTFSRSIYDAMRAVRRSIYLQPWQVSLSRQRCACSRGETVWRKGAPQRQRDQIDSWDDFNAPSRRRSIA